MFADMFERAKFVVDVKSGCWKWTGTIDHRGYGRVMVHRKNLCAHRFVYELFKGHIPGGRHLDHLCKNPPCVNPSHLEPVTPAENNLRSESLTAINLFRSQCKRGHPLYGTNLRMNGTHRVCRACEALRRIDNWCKQHRRYHGRCMEVGDERD